MSASQAPASEQYKNSKRFPSTYRAPTTEEWAAEVDRLTAELKEYERTVAHMRDGARLQDSATAAVMARAEKAEAKVKEQARLLSMSSEREARLVARVAELEKALRGLDAGEPVVEAIENVAEVYRAMLAAPEVKP